MRRTRVSCYGPFITSAPVAHSLNLTLPPLGHPSGAGLGGVRPLLAEQVGRDPRGTPGHNRIWHRGPTSHPRNTGCKTLRHLPMVCWRRGGRGQFWKHNRTFQGSTDQKGTAGILSGTDQENLGSSYAERGQSQGIFRGMGMMVFTKSRYLGGFIGDQYAETTWLYEKAQGWS